MKIVVYLSIKPYIEEEKTAYFYGEAGDFVMGSRTNDAPLEYFFEKYPEEISEVIVVCSKEAFDDGSFHRLEREIVRGRAKITKIDSDDGKKLSGELPIEVMKTLHKGEKEEILIDSTGGLRNDIISSLMTSELLSYHNIAIKEVIYSEYYKPIVKKEDPKKKNRLHSLKETTDLFLLIAGMQEFNNTGSIITLEKYFALGTTPTSILRMFSAITALNDSITLCRVDKIEEKINALNHALSQVKEEENPLFFMLISTFYKKYGENMNMLDLISWCVDNGKLQQALTLFHEKIPRYYFEHIIDPSANTWTSTGTKPYQDEFYLRLEMDFLDFEVSPQKKLHNFFKSEGFVKNMLDFVNGKGANPFPQELERAGHNLSQVIRTCFSSLDRRFSLLSKRSPDSFCVLSCGKITPKERTLEGYFKNMVNGLPLEQLSFLLDISHSALQVKEKKDFILLLENLGMQVKNKKYRISCTESQLKTLVQDYLYLKILRNQTNHASDNPSGSDELLHYLQGTEQDRYPSWDCLNTVQDMEELLKKMISSLKGIEKRDCGEKG